jgi:hypothetical protein
MIVSHFELLFKPQAPGPANGTAVDRVVQGYFLEITNLEDREFLYQVEFVMSPPSPGLPQRSLAGNAIYFVDTPPGTDNQNGVVTGAPAASVFGLSRGFIRIPARGTALLAVLPSVFGSALDPTPLTTPNFEVRGHVQIRLPALFPPFPPLSLFRQPQSDRPVKVLLTPQSRATFFSAANAITDQIQATLALAEGRALADLPPEPGGPLVFSPFNPSASKLPLRDLVANLEAPASDLLATLLTGFDPDEAGLAAFNSSLAKAGVPFTLQARKKG